MKKKRVLSLALALCLGLLPMTVSAAEAADDPLYNIRVYESTDKDCSTYTYKLELYGDFDPNEELALINAHRAELGLGALTLDPTLSYAAAERAIELSVYMSHTRPNLTKCFTILDELGYDNNTRRSENIACGYPTVQDVMDGWLSSTDGHKENIEYDKWKSVGLGCFSAADGFWRCWVQIFSDKEADLNKGLGGGSSDGGHSVTVAQSLLELSASPASLSMEVGRAETVTLLGATQGLNSTYYHYRPRITYAVSANTAVADVKKTSDGRVNVTALAEGSTTVTVGLTAMDGVTTTTVDVPVIIYGVGGSGDGGFTIENGVLTDYNGSGGDVTIPYWVTQIGWGAFYRCSNLTGVIIPDGVTTIGSDAFYNCRNLTSVTIPDSVTSIGYDAFSGCASLTSITIPASVTTIGEGAFDGCANLTVYGYAGSAAEAYCKDNSILFVSLEPPKVDLTRSMFTVDTAETAWTGSPITKTIQSDLTQGTDYTVTYANNTERGTATITITGIGGYTGTLKYTFPIVEVKTGAMPADAGGKSLTWTCSETGTVSVTTEALPQGEAVLAACYDAEGKFLGVQMLTRDKQTGKLNGSFAKIKLFWLGDKQSPLAPSVTAWEK